MAGAEAVFWVRNIVGGVLLYPAAPMLMVLGGLVAWHRRPRLAFGLIAAGLAVLLAFSLPIVANALAAFDEARFPPFDATKRLSGDTAIVVLGGGMQQGAADYGGETVNAITLARLRSAARLHRSSGLPILVSGGRLPGLRTAEATQMGQALTRDFQVPVRWIEDRSVNTTDNARFSAAILEPTGIRHVLLVTDVSHMRRARALFEAAQFIVTPAPTDYYGNAPVTVLSFIPQGNAMRRSSWAIHEWVGTTWDAITGPSRTRE